MSSIGSDKHPDLDDVIEDYQLVRDCYRGARRIKEKDVTYLPPTSGMVEDGLFAYDSEGMQVFNTRSIGFARYKAYLQRAVFPEFVQEAAETLVGIMHREPAVFKLPRAMEPMLKSATRKGESLNALLRRINLEQLLTGRIGLLVDAPPANSSRTTPHLVTYAAERIVNWDDETLEADFGVSRLQMVVLDESKRTRAGDQGLSWEDEPRFRMCFLEPEAGKAPVSTTNPLVYKTFLEVKGAQGTTVIPRFAGRLLNDIPFVFVGATDLLASPGIIPLLKLANRALTVYQGEADYRQSLFMQGQDTLVRKGHTPGKDDDGSETRTGAGSIIDVPVDGDAKFIGVSGKGLPEQAKALERDYNAAGAQGSRLVEPHGSQAESGEALRIRVAAATASLRQIALTGAAGLETALKLCARWMGLNEDEVAVIPNTDFAETREEPRGANDLMDAKAKGLPISLRSIHRWLQENDFTRLTYEEESEEIAKEKPLPARVQSAPTQSDVPEDDDGDVADDGDEGEDE